MKRLVIAITILGLILLIGGLSSYQVYCFQKDAVVLLEQMAQSAESGRLSAAAETAQEFYELWFQTKHSLIQFVRRDPLDHISRQAAQLPVLAQYGDMSGFAALTQDLKDAVQELWDDEIPYLQNLI